MVPTAHSTLTTITTLAGHQKGSMIPLKWTMIQSSQNVYHTSEALFSFNEYFQWFPKTEYILNVRLLNRDPAKVLTEAIDPYKQKLKKGVEEGTDEGWKYLMQADSTSTREFLSR